MLLGLLFQGLKQLVVPGLVFFENLGPAGLVLFALQGFGDIGLEGLHQFLHIRGQFAPSRPRRERETAESFSLKLET